MATMDHCSIYSSFLKVFLCLSLMCLMLFEIICMQSSRHPTLSVKNVQPNRRRGWNSPLMQRSPVHQEMSGTAWFCVKWQWHQSIRVSHMYDFVFILVLRRPVHLNDPAVKVLSALGPWFWFQSSQIDVKIWNTEEEEDLQMGIAVATLPGTWC